MGICSDTNFLGRTGFLRNENKFIRNLGHHFLYTFSQTHRDYFWLQLCFVSSYLIFLDILSAACMFIGGDLAVDPIYRRADGRRPWAYVKKLWGTRQGGSFIGSAVVQDGNPR